MCWSFFSVGISISVDFCRFDIFSNFRVRVQKRAFDTLFWHNHFIDNGIFLPAKLVQLQNYYIGISITLILVCDKKERSIFALQKKKQTIYAHQFSWVKQKIDFYYYFFINFSMSNCIERCISILQCSTKYWRFQLMFEDVSSKKSHGCNVTKAHVL